MITIKIGQSSASLSDLPYAAQTVIPLEVFLRESVERTQSGQLIVTINSMEKENYVLRFVFKEETDIGTIRGYCNQSVPYFVRAVDSGATTVLLDKFYYLSLKSADIQFISEKGYWAADVTLYEK